MLIFHSAEETAADLQTAIPKIVEPNQDQVLLFLPEFS